MMREWTAQEFEAWLRDKGPTTRCLIGFERDGVEVLVSVKVFDGNTEVGAGSGKTIDHAIGDMLAHYGEPLAVKRS